MGGRMGGALPVVIPRGGGHTKWWCGHGRHYTPCLAWLACHITHSPCLAWLASHITHSPCLAWLAALLAYTPPASLPPHTSSSTKP